MTLTTTEPDDVGTDVAVAPTTPVLTLDQWVRNLATTAEGVERIIDTPFIPASFWPLPPGRQLREMPNQDPARRLRDESEEDHAARRRVAIATTTTAINVGAELGLGPSAALKYLFVFRGRVQIYSEGMLALLHVRGHQHRTLERGPERARIAIRLRGRSDWTEYEFTIADAERAKYVEQNPKYRTDPRAMLWARVVSIAVRSECPEVLGGLAGEADGYDVIPGELADPAPAPARVTVEDITGPAPAAAGPEWSDDALEREPLTERTWRAIGETFVALGVTGPGQKERRLDILTRILGRPVSGRADVSESDGVVVVDTLRGLDDDGRVRLLGTGGPVEQPAPVEQVEQDPYGGADPDADPELDPAVTGEWPQDTEVPQ